VYDRSRRAETRNPLINLDAARRIQALPPETRQVLACLLRELSRDARARAERSWRQHKAPMAAYWKAVSVYAGHLNRLVRPTRAEREGRTMAGWSHPRRRASGLREGE
jgi:hypothetical protein